MLTSGELLSEFVLESGRLQMLPTARVYERAGFRDTTTMLHLRHER
jgi:hypothetical protein